MRTYRLDRWESAMLSPPTSRAWTDNAPASRRFKRWLLRLFRRPVIL